MSTVYLLSGTKDLLRSSVLFCQYSACSISGGLWSRTGKHFLERCIAFWSWSSERPECQRSRGRSARNSVVRIRKKSQGGVWRIWRMWGKTVIWFTEKNWRIMPFASVHCRVGGTTSLLLTTPGDDVKCCCIIYAVHLCWHLGLQFDPLEQILMPCTSAL